MEDAIADLALLLNTVPVSRRVAIIAALLAIASLHDPGAALRTAIILSTAA